MAVDVGLRRLALRTLLASFPGPTAPDWATELIADGLAGHVLFGFNIVARSQVSALTAALRSARADVLIGIDEEGGDVTRLDHTHGSPYPGNAALGAVDDPDLTRLIYRAIGTELASLGINLDLAPDVDVNTDDDNPVIGTRSFGADPALVSAHAAAAVAGLQQCGVAACAKHFPGHGATVTDSHLELPLVDAPVEVLRARELPPFAASIAAGVRSLMTAHLRIPVLTGNAPATFSRAVLVDLLRHELGFTGVVISDALEMRGSVDYAGSVPRAAVLALAAGCDLLCIGARVDVSLVEAVASEIATAVGDGRLPLGRVEEAASRVAALSSWAQPSPVGTVGAVGAGGTVGAVGTVGAGGAVDQEIGYSAALRAVRVEGSLDGLGTPLVVQLESESSMAIGRVPWGLGPFVDDQIRTSPARSDAAGLLRLAAGRPIVFVGRRVHALPGAPALVESVAAAAPVVLVEMGWPSEWRPQRVRAFVATYGASRANSQAAAHVLFPALFS